MKNKKNNLLLFKKTSIIELSRSNANMIIGGGYYDKTNNPDNTSDGRTAPTGTGMTDGPTHTDPSVIQPPSGPKNP